MQAIVSSTQIQCQLFAIYNFRHFSQLPETITNFDLKSIVPFPPFDGGKFRALLDKEMGFIV